MSHVSLRGKPSVYRASIIEIFEKALADFKLILRWGLILTTIAEYLAMAGLFVWYIGAHNVVNPTSGLLDVSTATGILGRNLANGIVVVSMVGLGKTFMYLLTGVSVVELLGNHTRENVVRVLREIIFGLILICLMSAAYALMYYGFYSAGLN